MGSEYYGMPPHNIRGREVLRFPRSACGRRRFTAFHQREGWLQERPPFLPLLLRLPVQPSDTSASFNPVVCSIESRALGPYCCAIGTRACSPPKCALSSPPLPPSTPPLQHPYVQCAKVDRGRMEMLPPFASPAAVARSAEVPQPKRKWVYVHPLNGLRLRRATQQCATNGLKRPDPPSLHPSFVSLEHNRPAQTKKGRVDVSVPVWRRSPSRTVTG